MSKYNVWSFDDTNKAWLCVEEGVSQETALASVDRRQFTATRLGLDLVFQAIPVGKVPHNQPGIPSEGAGSRRRTVEIACHECGVIDTLSGDEDTLNYALEERTDQHVRNRHYPGFSFAWDEPEENAK